MGIKDYTGTWTPSDSTGNAMDDFLYRNTAAKKEYDMVDIEVEKTFNFNEEAIRKILAEYIVEKHSVNVDPSLFKLKITDSTKGGYFENEIIPAKLDGFSITVKG